MLWLGISNTQWYRNQKVGLEALNLNLEAFYRGKPNKTKATDCEAWARHALFSGPTAAGEFNVQ